MAMWSSVFVCLLAANTAFAQGENRALGGYFSPNLPSWKSFLPSNNFDSIWKKNHIAEEAPVKEYKKLELHNDSDKSHLNADDVFDGLSEVWNSENSNVHPIVGNEDKIPDELPTLPDHYYVDFSTSQQSETNEIDLSNVTNNIHDSNHNGNNYSGEPNQAHLNTAQAPQDHWTRLKSILGNMRGILEREFPGSDSDDKLTFEVLDKIISFGDKMDILKRLNKTFNNGLVNFLSQKWIDISESIINGSPVLKALFSVSSNNLSSSLFMPLLKGVGHLFQNNALKHLEDLDFVTDLMRSSGFQDIEINEVFNLLDINTTSTFDDNNLQVEGRQYGNSFMEKSGGYGHSGGYGGGGGYASHGGGGYMMQTIDPFVLLAGLAFATFLAFLLFRLLSQTTGKRRSVPDMSLNLDLSDMPEVMTNLYNFLDTAEKKFGYNSTDSADPIDRFGTSANSLWTTFQADRMERSCMKRYLCEAAGEEASIDTSEATTALHQLALTALAQILGEEQGARMVDGIQHHRLQGHPQECRTLAPHCDDTLYSSVMVPHGIAS